MINNQLIFGKGNAKLDSYIGTFSLPAAYSCPSAYLCQSFANRKTGKITDGKHTQFRCFAATSEQIFPSVRKARWHNFELIKSCKSSGEMTNLIQSSIPANTTYIRTHVSGDFYNENYFQAWMQFAKNNPTTIIYGYSKQIHFLVKYKKQIPSNFRFTASLGGLHDNLIHKHKLISAQVVYSVNDAKEKGLEIDHDDSKAIEYKKSFALLLHGMQPAGSNASLAMSKLRKAGYIGYSNKRDSKNTNPHFTTIIHINSTPLQFRMFKNKLTFA